MDAAKVVQNLFMKSGQLHIQTDRTVAFSLGAFLLVGATGATLTFIELLCSAILVSLHRSGTLKRNFLLFGQIRLPSSSVLKFTARNGSSRYFCWNFPSDTWGSSLCFALNMRRACAAVRRGRPGCPSGHFFCFQWELPEKGPAALFFPAIPKWFRLWKLSPHSTE